MISFINRGSSTPPVSKPYKELTYLETDRNQYINTGVIASPDIKFEIKFNNKTDGSKDYEVLFGARSAGSKNFALYLKDIQNRSMLTTCGYNNYSQMDFEYLSPTDYANGTYINKDVEITLKKIEDKEYDRITVTNGVDTTTKDVELYDAYTRHPIHLFGQYAEDVAEGETSNIVDRCMIKFYYFKIYKGDVLVRDFIPVKDTNNVVCLYDKVTQKFFYNEGTGVFVGGAEV